MSAAVARDDLVMIAGARGMVGSAIARRLRAAGYLRLLTPPRDELDLLDGAAVRAYLSRHRPSYVFVAAAKVGGILANDRYRADFLYENLAIATNLVHGAHLAGVERLMYLGSSCAYPRLAPQPLREEALLTGPLEPTNEPYAIAKIAGIKLCETYRAQHGRRYVAVMPTNLYGPGDQYDLARSHVVPALLRKAHEAARSGAASLSVWGSGAPRRELLYVDDLADACAFLMETGYDGPLLNIGSGEDLSIREIAERVAATVGFQGDIVLDPSKPDGAPQKLLDVSRMTALGWRARTPLREGLRRAYEDYRARFA